MKYPRHHVCYFPLLPSTSETHVVFGQGYPGTLPGLSVRQYRENFVNVIRSLFKLLFYAMMVH
jgi:hypothetical protein